MPIQRIIVIDDEELIVKLCKRVLSGEGYEVTGVSSGAEALKVLSEEHFHMVITDMLMPGMDGLETFLALREKQPGLLGVMITGHGTIDMAIQAMDRGLSGFVRKPFMPRELAQVVKDAFTKSALSEENTRLKTLIPLYELAERFISSQSMPDIFDGLVEVLAQQTGAQRISTMIYDAEEGVLRIVSAKGIDRDIARKVRIRPGEKIAGRVYKEGRPLIINGGPENNPRIKHLLASKDIAAAISFPFKTRDKILGVLNISKIGRVVPFTESDIEMVSIICRQAVMALENLETMNEKAEKIRVRTLLEQYLAPEVTEMLLSRGQDLLEVGEIRTVAILFADIRNFTPLVRQIPLKTIRSFLNDFFGLFSEVIFKFRGTMDKFMGDAVLALFGAPVPVEEPETASVDSAVLVQKAFNELKEAWRGENEILGEIGLGIGISAGEVFLGNVGSKRRLDYTVIGTDVNIAQRLSSEAASGEILFTERVRRSLGSRFRIIHESSRHLKGMEEAVSVFSMST
ncbi:MAG: response regulator [Deltaproteobacteria bacterium]|nr:response regulator [Deltaproteobacteria bacterium]